MSRRIRRNRSGSHEAQRIARHHVDEAIEALQRRWPPSHEAIHSARKSLKRARGALRLIRPALGERVFGRENAALGDAARPLGSIRDAFAILSAYDRVTRRVPLSRKIVAAFRATLETHDVEVRDRAFARSDRQIAILEPLRSAGRRIDRLAPKGGWSTLGPGLRRLYRSGKRALAVAREDPTPQHLHDWRRRAKALWYALEMLQSSRPREIARRVQQLHDLTDGLGEDHDLVVLRRRVVSPDRAITAATRRAILDRIDSRRHQLQAKAMALGGEIFEEKPGAFERRMEGWWRSWRGDR